MYDADADEDYYYAHDHLYSPTALLDDSGAVVERIEYNAYGQADVTLISGSGTGNEYLFTGRRLDILDGGSYIWARLLRGFICSNLLWNKKNSPGPECRHHRQPRRNARHPYMPLRLRRFRGRSPRNHRQCALNCDCCIPEVNRCPSELVTRGAFK